jgi:hypothetical protein
MERNLEKTILLGLLVGICILLDWVGESSCAVMIFQIVAQHRYLTPVVEPAGDPPLHGISDQLLVLIERF